ncbi:MAG: gliding motility-associated ABC transporter ATP-binding subunit GldA [Saprospiraceae bacterium]|uniref:Gliding motility-associated ABC transporter ATP-binding subunit GldA n=1 Tax=Candidatus Defluviibacterium haderslevense TaxID=2981993 RepID=A0A9D7SBX7_9BACT|nr:gliding motility-associated ABC transporter ATP-binding subunit GldA [Candidatus Defluviibacterium haderslevense]MBK8244398.1 gliding motility-associated ABC transporter ATP-binding subunit GldA [Candidatus Defluviibacterium haderslevense]MBK9719583.1 gliding motility-associated ABC transporter ATP-binding subunit GldA [Candidatus Defluviibacterium haderslevense]MBL0237975.1 gliding motility-associated ABC transporter ATP-binding subunit GldA [Candidatus Defluviibacterium haderslevense]
MSIVVNQITKIYGTQHAVDELSFTAHKGEILGFLGPNGAGKTTTMKMLSCYIKPSSGSAEICGYNILTHPLEVKKHIGYLPENNPLYKDMYIREYLECFARLSKVEGVQKRINDLIELTGLGPEQNKTIGSVSKGYRQRVGLSQALLHNPEVLILDEPTSGLDPNQLVEIRSLIRNIGKEKTLIFSTHIMQEVKSLCDRVVIIKNGKLVADDSIEVLQEKLGDRQMVTIEFSTEIPISTIKSLPYVQFIKQSGKHQFTIYSDSAKDLRELLFQTSVANGWVIYEMNKTKNSIEDVFNVLTKQ